MSNVIGISTPDFGVHGGPGVDSNSPLMVRGYPVGTSTESFIYVGTLTDRAGNVSIVFQAKNLMKATGLTADGAGGVFDPGGSSTYCCLNLGPVSNQSWTVRLRTSKDGSGGGVFFAVGSISAPGGL